MLIRFNEQEIEITDYEMVEDGCMVTEAYNHTTERELTEAEMEHISIEAFDQIYEKRPKGTGY